MRWAYGGIILLILSIVLRRVLRLGQASARSRQSLLSLSPEVEAIYQPVAREVETQTSMLAISLNDAFQERDAQRDEIAWGLVQLAASEWVRPATEIEAMLRIMTRYTAGMNTVVPPHSIVARRFRSRLMIDQVRLYELLDQLVFRSKLRFQLQIRLLRRAAEVLTAEFRRTCRSLELNPDDAQELWQRLDHYFHDFDLVSKEALLALRALLVSLPEGAREEFGAALQGVLEHGVRWTAT